MTVARRGLKVKVMGQANAVGPTSMEDSFFYYVFVIAITDRRLYCVCLYVCPLA